MTTTAQQVSTRTVTGSSDERRTLPWALIVALIALAALTIAVVTWQLMATPNTTAPPDVVPKAAADQPAPYRPGGSVYQQQVPRAAADQLAPYRPGGSVYQQQVPGPQPILRAAFRPGGSSTRQHLPRPQTEHQPLGSPRRTACPVAPSHAHPPAAPRRTGSRPRSRVA